jgi:hypothetical protein
MIWWRLFAAEAPGPPGIVIGFESPPEDVFPRSMLAHTVERLGWREWAEAMALPPERVLVLVGATVYVGPATEEAWESALNDQTR